MAIRDDVILLLKNELGKGYETTLLPDLIKAYAMKTLKPKLIALYKQRLDYSALIASRVAVETTLKNEIQSMKNAEEVVLNQLESDIGGI